MRFRTVALVAVLGLVCLAWPALAQEPGRSTTPGPRAGRGDVRPVERTVRRYSAVRPGVHLRVLRDYTLAEGETTSEAIVVIGGDARIDGEARKDVTVVGGTLRLGPSAVVAGRVTALGTRTVIAPGAEIRGPLDRVAIQFPAISVGPIAGPRDWTAVQATLAAFRLGFVLAVALGLTLLAPGWIRAIAERPLGASGLIGLATEMAAVPVLLMVTVALVVSIVGIPLLGLIPFALFAAAVVWAAGFAGVAARLGGLQPGAGASRLAPAGGLLRGYAVIVSITVVGHLLALGPDWLDGTAGWVRAAGWVVEFAAWTIGLGAGLASLVATRRVPTLPPAAPA